MPESEEPKLIVDEDWKTQVQREKEQLKRQVEASDEQTAEKVVANEGQVAEELTAEGDVTEDQKEKPAVSSGKKQEQQFPEANIQLLVTSLATQAMAALGQFPDENGQLMEVNLGLAKHFIDLIAVIEEKTRGNLSQEEAGLVAEALHQLRMGFVAVSQQQR